jgi:thiol-disulfide isomerase/thioredoxin
MRFWLTLGLTLLAATALAAEPLPFNQGSWRELRHQHAGRPTIVHFWGLTCGPCLVELPQWGKFAQTVDGVETVMVAADPLPQPAASLTANLAKAGLAKIESWSFADAFTERLEYEIDPNWRGELPFTVLIGRDGSVTSMLGTVKFADLRTWAERQNTAAR